LEIAESGGKHAGFLKTYQGKSPEELRRGIASLQKQIALHKDKIANPEKHIPNWSSLDPRQQEARLWFKRNGLRIYSGRPSSSTFSKVCSRH